jgi:hypothetical protein
LNDSTSVSKAESQLAEPLVNTIVFDVSVTSSPNGSAGAAGRAWLGAGGVWADAGWADSPMTIRANAARRTTDIPISCSKAAKAVPAPRRGADHITVAARLPAQSGSAHVQRLAPRRSFAI